RMTTGPDHETEPSPCFRRCGGRCRRPIGCTARLGAGLSEPARAGDRAGRSRRRERHDRAAVCAKTLRQLGATVLRGKSARGRRQSRHCRCRSGAGGRLYVARWGGNFVINRSLYAKIPYDPYNDFAAVSLMCSSPHVLAVHPSVAASTVKEFVALVKASPGHYSYASAGRGPPAPLAGEPVKLRFRLDM